MKKNYLKCGVALLAIASAFSAFAETKTLEFDFSKGTGEGFGGNIGQSYTGEGKAMFINKSQKTFTANNTEGKAHTFRYYQDKNAIQVSMWTDALQFGSSTEVLGGAFLALNESFTNISKIEVAVKAQYVGGVFMIGTVTGANADGSFNLSEIARYENNPAEYTTYTLDLAGKEKSGNICFKIYSGEDFWFRIKSIKITYEDATPTIEPLHFEAKTTTDAERYFATFSSDKDVIIPAASDVEVNAVSASGSVLTMNKLATANYTTTSALACNNTVNGYLVPANTGVLISMPTVYFYETTAVYTANVADAAPIEGNQLKHTYEGTIDALPNHYIYRLAYDNKENETGLGFYWGNNDGTQILNATPGKAYLEVPITHGAPSIRGFSFDGNHLTAVEDIKVNDEAINANEPIYDLSGRRVVNPTKGFYIQGNKKFVIR